LGSEPPHHPNMKRKTNVELKVYGCLRLRRFKLGFTSRFKSLIIKDSTYPLKMYCFLTQCSRTACQTSGLILRLVGPLVGSLTSWLGSVDLVGMVSEKDAPLYKFLVLGLYTTHKVYKELKNYLTKILPLLRRNHMKNHVLSPTTLSLFIECKRCFHEHFYGQKRPPSIFPGMPGGVDRAMKKRFDEYRRRLELPPELSILEGHMLFPNQPLLDYWRNTGLKWKDEQGNVLMGKIDDLLLETKTQKKIILDFKTKGDIPNPTATQYCESQLAIYTFLLLQTGHKISGNAHILFLYPTTNRDGEIHLTSQLATIKIDLIKAQTTFEQAIKCLNNPTPPTNPDCPYCKYRGTKP